MAPVGCAKSVAMARPELWVRPARHGEIVDAAAADDDDDADVASAAAAVGAVAGSVGDVSDDDGGGGKSDSRYFFCRLCFRAYCNVALIGQSSYLNHRRIERVAVGDDHNR